MSKPVAKHLYKNFLQKAAETSDAAKYAAFKSENTAALVASVHRVINSIDALAVFYLDRRLSGGYRSTMRLSNE